jgi:O-antigen/teichoic acid export membrane protein
MRISKKNNAQLLSGILVAVIAILRVPVLARYISPEEFGGVAIVQALIGVFLIFGDFGLSTAAIQKDSFNKNDIRAYNAFHLAIGVLFFLIINTFVYLTGYYESDDLNLLSFLLSLDFLFSSFSAVPMVLLKRHFRFEKLSIVTIFSSIISSLLGITLALKGYGIWALVIMQLTTSFLNSIITLFLSKENSYGKFIRDTELNKSLRFGLLINTTSLLNRLVKNLDNLILQRFTSLYYIGLYSRSKSLMDILGTQFRGAISSVSFSYLSKYKADEQKTLSIFQKSLSKLLFIHSSIAFILFFFSREIIILYLGENWIEVSGTLKIFSVYLIGLAILAMFDQLYLAHGLLKVYNHISILRNVFRVILIFTFIVFYKERGSALAWSVAELIIALISILTANRFFQFIRIKEVIHLIMFSVLGPFLASMLVMSFDYVFHFPNQTLWIFMKLGLVSLISILLGALFQRVCTRIGLNTDINLLRFQW